uniref:BAG family molecular chaperone regulator 8ic n=1 Tax=Rhizophora mucronata TaxID=61149 RepID=A0A2P2JEW4_RHIMU
MPTTQIIIKIRTFVCKTCIFHIKMPPTKPSSFYLLFFNESALSNHHLTIFLHLLLRIIITILHILFEIQPHVLFKPIFVPFSFVDHEP